jgi:hypothetical protein
MLLKLRIYAAARKLNLRKLEHFVRNPLGSRPLESPSHKETLNIKMDV